MRFKSFLPTVLLLSISCAISSVQADVVLDFNTAGNTEGFVNSGGVSVTQDPFNGGSLRVEALGGAAFFEAAARAATLSFASGSAFEMELALALVNGGEITFDAFVQDGDINDGVGGPPSQFPIVFTLESGFSTDTENLVLGLPAPGSPATGSFQANIVPGSGNQFNATDNSINFANNGTRSFSFGILDGGDTIADGVFFIDNFRVSAAVPEPSSLVGLWAIAGVTLLRRKRSAA